MLAFTREILTESEDFLRIWPGRARNLSLEVCTPWIANKTVPRQSEDFEGTRTLSSEDVIRIRLYHVLGLKLVASDHSNCP